MPSATEPQDPRTFWKRGMAQARAAGLTACFPVTGGVDVAFLPAKTCVNPRALSLGTPSPLCPWGPEGLWGDGRLAREPPLLPQRACGLQSPWLLPSLTTRARRPSSPRQPPRRTQTDLRGREACQESPGTMGWRLPPAWLPQIGVTGDHSTRPRLWPPGNEEGRGACGCEGWSPGFWQNLAALQQATAWEGRWPFMNALCP